MNREIRLLTAPLLLIACLCCGGLQALVCADAAKSESKLGSNYAEVKSLSLKQALGTKSDWHVSAFASSAEDGRTGDGIPVKVSFWKDAAHKSEKLKEIKVTREDGSHYEPQTLQELKLVKLNPTQKGVLSVARFNGGGSGSLDLISIWTYSKSDDSFGGPSISLNLTEQGEYKLVDSGPMAGFFITCDDDIDFARETHFDPHRFYVKVYKYSQAASGTYVKLLEYRTTDKYDQASNEAKVIAHELPKIQRLLASAYGAKGLADIN